MTTVSSIVAANSSEFMTKTPFLKARSVSSSFEDEEEEEEEPLPQPLEEVDDDHRIEISKRKVSNSLPVVNKMNQHVYNDHQNPAKGLKRYKILSLIGDGTYGLVYMANNVETREKVAIKAMKRKYHSWDEVMDLREVKSLKKLHHPNVVKLKEVIRENSRLYFVFEYVKGDLLGLMREKAEPFPEFWIRSVIQQVLQGLTYMHRLGFFHRDLKPENILATGPDVVKIADFGLVREIRSSPPYTDYVSTRWYRAPEVLLRSTNYNSPIDIWAVGCITSELYTKRPLFPGTSEIDQLYKIASIMGTPGRNDWPDGYVLANNMSFRFPTFSPTHLSQVLGPRSSARAVSFLYALLAWNPSWRSSAQEALRHSYFRMSNNGLNNGLKADLNSLYPEDKCEAAETESMLSLSLRPRNNGLLDQQQQSQQLQPLAASGRMPLPLTEIEPHFSRDLARRLTKQASEERPKSPQQQPQQQQPSSLEDDLHDLISAFSLDSSKRSRGNRGRLLILSPPKASPIGASLRLTKRQPQKLTRSSPFQNTYHSNGLHFSPTATKFTLLYGHQQPPTFKIVSPSKLGLEAAREAVKQPQIEEIMGKRIGGPSSKLTHHQFRSLPDFVTKKAPTTTQILRPRPADEATINVNGKGLVNAADADQQRAPRIQVRPDWAAKYLK